MSLEYMNRAYRVTAGSPTIKLVLMLVADAVENNGVGWVAVSRIVKWSELSERAVRNSIAALEKMGMLQVQKQAGEFRTNRYVLQLPDWREGAPGAPSTVQDVHLNGAPGAPCTPCTLHDVHHEGASGAGGMVHPVHPDGAPGAPNPSISSGTRLNSSLSGAVAPGDKTGPAFPDDFSDALKAPLIEWWYHKQEQKAGYKPRGWAAVLKHARDYSPEIVKETVQRAMIYGWPGVRFDVVAKEMAATAGGNASPPGVAAGQKKGGAFFSMENETPHAAHSTVAADAGPEGWKMAAEHLYGDAVNAYDEWNQLPEANKKDVRTYLVANEKNKGA